MMEDMLFKKEQGPHDPVCDVVKEYRAMMQGEQQAFMRRREEKEEPPTSNINNKQPFEHVQKIQALNTNWKKKDMNTKGKRHV